MTIKKLLNSTLENLLIPMRDRRAKLSNDDVRDILKEGTKKARAIAQETIDNVRKCMGIHYY